MSRHIRSVRYRSATQVGYFQQAQHTRVAQFVSLEVTDSTYESIYLVAFILAGPVYNNELKNRAALLCRTQCRVARLCSRIMVSDAANTRIHERTQCVSAEEKILCRSSISQRSHVGNLRQTI